MPSNRTVGRGVGQAAAMLLLSLLAQPLAAQKYTFEEVASGLKHQDPSTRLRAIQILRDADYIEAIGPIATVLGDPDDRVQLAALAAERTLLTTRPVSRRRRVGYVLEVRSSTAGGNVLAEGQLALKAVPVPASVLSGIAVALGDTNPRVRSEAMALTALLAPHPCNPRRTSARELSDACALLGNALINSINSKEPQGRRAAMQVLGHLKYSNGVQALSDQLSYYQKGPDALAALEGLARIGSSTSVTAFTQALTSENASMRRLGVEGLGRSGARASVRDLQELGQTERSTEVLLAIHFALAQLGGDDSSTEQIVATLRDRTLRPLAIQYLLDLAPTHARRLAASLKDPSGDTRRIVADVLGFSNAADVIPALQESAKDADQDVALAAERAIERLKGTSPGS